MLIAQALKAQLDKERAEVEARVAEDSRLQMEAAARKAELETQSMMELQLAETARLEAERAEVRLIPCLSATSSGSLLAFGNSLYTIL